MTFKPALWFPIAVVLSVANLVGVGFAAASAEGAHAAIHAGLALLFGLWAQRLRQRLGRRDLATPLDAPEALAALEADVNRLRQEVSEMQERLDFAERLLAQGPERRRAVPEPYVLNSGRVAYWDRA